MTLMALRQNIKIKILVTLKVNVTIAFPAFWWRFKFPKLMRHCGFRHKLSSVWRNRRNPARYASRRLGCCSTEINLWNSCMPTCFWRLRCARKALYIFLNWKSICLEWRVIIMWPLHATHHTATIDDKSYLLLRWHLWSGWISYQWTMAACSTRWGCTSGLYRLVITWFNSTGEDRSPSHNWSWLPLNSVQL